MKTPSTLTLTFNTEPLAKIEADNIEAMGLDSLPHEIEQQLHTLLQHVHAGAKVYHVPRPAPFLDYGRFSIVYLGKCAHGRLIEVKTTNEDGVRRDSYGLLVGHDGDIAVLSTVQEAFSADCRSAVRYDREGEIARIDLSVHLEITKLAIRWLTARLGHHRVAKLHIRNYRPEWHDHTPATLQAEPVAKPTAKPAAKSLRKAG